MSGIIYHLFCTVTGKAYVGQTWQSLDRRWRDHRKPSSRCLKLYRAVQKYGVEVFVCSILTQGLTTQEDMDAAEGYWIEYFNCIDDGYNIRGAGSRGRLSAETRIKIGLANRGKRRSVETKMKLSQIRLGKKSSEETRAKLRAHRHPLETREKISEALRGRVLSPETRSRIGAASHIRGVSEQTRLKIGLANSGRVRSNEMRLAVSRKLGGKPFVDQNGVRYETLMEAARSLSLVPSHISAVLHGRALSTGGYIFQYLEAHDGAVQT